MKRAGRPTDLELEILKTLWERGPSTVRDVQEALSGRRPVGYTTVLKMLQVMAEKRQVLRDETARAHVYRARESRRVVLGRLARDLVMRAFDGSAHQLVLHALDPVHTTQAELAEIRSLLDDLEGSDRNG